MATAKKSTKRSKQTPQNSFMTLRFTHESAYWLLLTLLVLALGIWVLSLTARVQNLYDQIDTNNTTTQQMTEANKKQ